MTPDKPNASSDFLKKASFGSRISGRWYSYLIGGYFLKEELGHGGQATVFKALNGKEGYKPYAIKRFAIPNMRGGQQARHQETYAKTLREAEMMRTLHTDPDRSNLHILRVFESLVTQRHLYIVLEYCSKGSLDKEIRRSQDSASLKDPENYVGLSEQRAVFYLTQVVNGMLEVWAQRIIHRDIKLDNLMLTDDNIVKIADFGFAIYDNEEKTWAGTLTHMAPEVLEISVKKRQGDYDFRIDLWSIGVTFYQLLHGRVPFYGYTASAMYEEIKKSLEKGLKFGDHVGPEARNLIAGLLEFDPQKRLVGDRLTNHVLFQKYKMARQGSALQRNVLQRYQSIHGTPTTTGPSWKQALQSIEDSPPSIVPDAKDVIERELSSQNDVTFLILYGVQEISHVYLHDLNKINFLAFVAQQLFLFIDSYNFHLADFGLVNLAGLILNLASQDALALLAGLQKRANTFDLDLEFFRFILDQESGLNGEIITPRLKKIETQATFIANLLANYQLVLTVIAKEKKVALVHVNGKGNLPLSRPQVFTGISLHVSELQYYASKNTLKKNPKVHQAFQRLLLLLGYVTNYDNLFPYYDKPEKWGKFDWKAFRSAIETIHPKEIDQMLKGRRSSNSRPAFLSSN